MPIATPGQEQRFRAAGRCLLLSVKRSSAGQARYPPFCLAAFARRSAVSAAPKL